MLWRRLDKRSLFGAKKKPQTNIAMEHWPFTDLLPIKHGDFHSYVSLLEGNPRLGRKEPAIAGHSPSLLGTGAGSAPCCWRELRWALDVVPAVSTGQNLSKLSIDPPKMDGSIEKLTHPPFKKILDDWRHSSVLPAPWKFFRVPWHWAACTCNSWAHLWISSW